MLEPKIINGTYLIKYFLKNQENLNMLQIGVFVSAEIRREIYLSENGCKIELSYSNALIKFKDYGDGIYRATVG